MNKAEYASRILTQPWNIHRLRARSILGNLTGALLRDERPDEDLFGDPLPKMQVIGDIALIPMSGVIALNVPGWIKSLGVNLTDAIDIEEEVAQAVADANVERIVFDIDSPGGSALAGELLYEVIEAANRKKPVHAWAGDGRDICSTAYLAVAGATSLACGYFAEAIGCIGTYLAMLDDTQFWLQAGMKWEVFRSGELKGIGEDGISPEQRDYLQGLVDDHGARFRKSVSRHRTEIAAEDMRGQWFDGKSAAARGFVGFNADNLNAAIAKFRRQ